MNRFIWDAGQVSVVDRPRAKGFKALAESYDDLPALVKLAEKLEPAMRRRFLAAIQRIKDAMELERLKGNDCHNPAGSPEGGQFCGGEGGVGETSNEIQAHLNIVQVKSSIEALTKWENVIPLLAYGEKDYRHTPIPVEGGSVGKLGGFTEMRADVDHNYSRQRVSEIREVNIDQLVTYQNYVSGAKLRLLADTYNEWIDDKDGIATVSEFNGKYWIVDGNHRIALLKLAGKQTAKVEFHPEKSR